MANITYLRRVSETIELIKTEKSGSALALSKHFGVSERTIFRLIKDVSLFTGRKIIYDNVNKSYVFLGNAPKNPLTY